MISEEENIWAEGSGSSMWWAGWTGAGFVIFEDLHGNKKNHEIEKKAPAMCLAFGHLPFLLSSISVVIHYCLCWVQNYVRSVLKFCLKTNMGGEEFKLS